MRVYREAIEMNRKLAQVASVLERHDRDLLRQLKRAASSVPLNLSEGMGNQAGNRELRFQTALGSAKEVKACLEVARAWGYLDASADVVVLEVDRLVAMLFRLVHSRR